MKAILAIVFVLLVSLVGYFAWEYSLKPTQLEAVDSERIILKSHLEEYVSIGETLANRKDYTLVENGTHYQTDIGMYNDFPVEFVYECWGDLCPNNGDYYVRYKGQISEEQCNALKGFPVWGYGWGPRYGGCSPIFIKGVTE